MCDVIFMTRLTIYQQHVSKEVSDVIHASKCSGINYWKIEGRQAPVKKTENPPPSLHPSVHPSVRPSVCLSFPSLFSLLVLPLNLMSLFPPSLRTSTSHHAPFPSFLPSFHPLFLPSPLYPPRWRKLLFAANTFPISCPANLRYERDGELRSA